MTSEQGCLGAERSKEEQAVWFHWGLPCVKREVEVAVGGDVEPIRKLLLARQRDLNFILYIWDEMLKDFHQVVK